MPSEPSGTNEQVPSLPAASQESQLDPQVVLQQNPSRQKLLVHWLSEVQAVPFGSSGTQVPLSQ